MLGDDRGDLVHLELGEDRRQELIDDDDRAPLHRLEVVAHAEQALHHALAHVRDVGPALPEVRILDPLEGVAIGVEDLAQGVARVARLVDRLARRSGRSPCPRGSGSGCGRPPRTRGRSARARRRASRRSRGAPRPSPPRNPRAPSSTSAAGTYSILSRSVWRSIRKIGPIATPRAVASPRSVTFLSWRGPRRDARPRPPIPGVRDPRHDVAAVVLAGRHQIEQLRVHDDRREQRRAGLEELDVGLVEAPGLDGLDHDARRSRRAGRRAAPRSAT